MSMKGGYMTLVIRYHQAVRFRVYAYDCKNTVLAELNANNNYTLTWTANVASKKAAGRVFQRNGI